MLALWKLFTTLYFKQPPLSNPTKPPSKPKGSGQPSARTFGLAIYVTLHPVNE